MKLWKWPKWNIQVLEKERNHKEIHSHISKLYNPKTMIKIPKVGLKSLDHVTFHQDLALLRLVNLA